MLLSSSRSGRNLTLRSWREEPRIPLRTWKSSFAEKAQLREMQSQGRSVAKSGKAVSYRSYS